MYRNLMLAMVALLPAFAWADDLPANANNWRDCKADEDCVLIDGICGPTAVNAGYRTDATRYYAGRVGDKACKNQFWIPKSNGVRCRLDSCEAIVK